MKRSFLLVILFCLAIASSFCQNKITNNQIPPFRVLLTNGTYFQGKDVPKNKPFVVIYFAPDCDHCIKLTDELFKKINLLEKATILMVTFRSPQELIPFEKKYNIGRYPNIKLGTEGTSYYLRNFYRLQKTPFTAVYDKNGRLAYSYKEETPVNEFLTRFKKL